MDNKKPEKKELDMGSMDQATGGLRMGYDPRIMDCPNCEHHMLKREYVDDRFVNY